MNGNEWIKNYKNQKLALIILQRQMANARKELNRLNKELIEGKVSL